MEPKVSGRSFRKFWSTSQGCPFFWKFGNSGNFLFHLAFYPVWICPSCFSREKLPKMGASLSTRRYTRCKIICHSSSLLLIAYSPRYDLIFWKIVDWSFRISRGLVRSVWRSGKYRSLRHMKISEKQAGIFGRMERTLILLKPEKYSVQNSVEQWK